MKLKCCLSSKKCWPCHKQITVLPVIEHQRASFGEVSLDRGKGLRREKDGTWFFSVYPYLPWNITMVTAPVKMIVYLGHSIKGAWACEEKKEENEIKYDKNM